MFLICLLLIGLVAIAIVTDIEPSTAEQAEFIPVPVRVAKTKNFSSQHLDHSRYMS
jgi:hypothetical protein